MGHVYHNIDSNIFLTYAYNLVTKILYLLLVFLINFLLFLFLFLPINHNKKKLDRFYLELLINLHHHTIFLMSYELIFIKLPKTEILSLLYGFLFSFVGLVIFLTGVNAIMSPFGTRVGVGLGLISEDWTIILVCFIIGLVTILCEPAVHVLTSQINEISDGTINKKTVLVTLSIGVGVAIALSAIRTLYNFNILYIVVPGYVLSIVLMFICPNIFTAMAFDAGGTASGPMSTSFVLPMMIGITYSRNPDYGAESVMYYTQSFGVVALIALTPILAIQLLGVVQTIKKAYRLRVMSGQIKDPTDAQIIHFEKE